MQASQNSARWAIYVPKGWHVLRFSHPKSGVRSAGVQLSNVRLPPPAQLPGEPAEANAEALPPRGVGLVIATAIGGSPAHVKVAAPPLPLPWPLPSPRGSQGWLIGSSPTRGPVFEWLWFRIGGTMYVAALTIGWKVSRADQKALGLIVRSIKSKAARS